MSDFRSDPGEWLRWCWLDRSERRRRGRKEEEAPLEILTRLPGKAFFGFVDCERVESVVVGRKKKIAERHFVASSLFFFSFSPTLLPKLVAPWREPRGYEESPHPPRAHTCTIETIAFSQRREQAAREERRRRTNSKEAFVFLSHPTLLFSLPLFKQTTRPNITAQEAHARAGVGRRRQEGRAQDLCVLAREARGKRERDVF